MTIQTLHATATPTRPAGYGIGPDTVTRRVLANGLTLLLFRNPASAAVSARLSIKAGAIFDPPELQGRATFAAAAMRRGTLRQTFDQLNERTEARGLSVGVDAGYHLTEVGGRSLAEDTRLLLDTIAEIVQFPAFPLDELERLRSQALSGLRQQEDSTGAMSSRLFRQNAYTPDHPYHRQASGTIESVSALRREDLRNYVRTALRPDQATLVVVGDVQTEDVIALAEDAFGRWASVGAALPFDVPDAAPPDEIIRVHHFITGKTQDDLVLGFPAIRHDDPDYYAMELMNLLLGRLGLYGRLGKSVREEQGLAYGVSSSFEAGFGPGPWRVHAGVNPANVNRAVESILGEMRRIQDEPVGEQEIAAGQRYLTGSLPLRLETNEGLARTLLEMELYDLGFDYVQRYPQLALNQTAADVQRAAQRHLHTDRYVLVTAGPDVEG